MAGRDATEGLKDAKQMTTMHISYDQFGKMHSETATETTGLDANGNRVATRETKQGAAADAEAEKMMGQLGPIMGLLGGFMQQRRDPVMDMLQNMMHIAEMEQLGAAEQALRNPLRGLPVQILHGIPHEKLHSDQESGHEGHHHHDGHCCSENHSEKVVHAAA